MAGDWVCGETEVFISRLASIEILEDEYTAGLFDAQDGRMEIEWDDGDRASWTYKLDSNTALVLSNPGERDLSCVSREE